MLWDADGSVISGKCKQQLGVLPGPHRALEAAGQIGGSGLPRKKAVPAGHDLRAERRREAGKEGQEESW